MRTAEPGQDPNEGHDLVPAARFGGEVDRDLRGARAGDIPWAAVPCDGDREQAGGVRAAATRGGQGGGGGEVGGEEAGEAEEGAGRGEGRRGEQPAQCPRAARGGGRGGEEDLGELSMAASRPVLLPYARRRHGR